MEYTEQQLRQMMREEIAKTDSKKVFTATNQGTKHVHNGSDMPQISQANIIPNTRASGSITFAQSAVYRLGITFNPTSVWFYGAAFRTNSTFAVTAANATAGDIYSNNGHTFTVVSTITAGTTLITYGTGQSVNASGSPITNAASSGTLTKVSGSGDATITFASVTAGFGVRTHCVGNAQLGSSFYFQPQTSTSVQEGGAVLSSIQSSTSFLVDTSTSTPIVRAIVDEEHIVDVEYSGVQARATITSYDKQKILITTSLGTGWSIIGNYVVT